MCPHRRRAAIVLIALVTILAFSAGAATAAESVRLSLSREPNDDGSARIVAAVADASGKPVAGESVTFRVKTAFGWLTVAEVETGPDGRAAIVLPAEPRYAEVQGQAGGGDARAGLRLSEIASTQPAVRPGRGVLRGLSPQPGFISPYPPPQILFVAGLLGGIWITYGYLMWLLIRLRRVT